MKANHTKKPDCNWSNKLYSCDNFELFSDLGIIHIIKNIKLKISKTTTRLYCILTDYIASTAIKKPAMFPKYSQGPVLVSGAVEKKLTGQ